MSKKKVAPDAIFQPDPDDPLDKIFCAVLNMGSKYGLQLLSREMKKRFGLETGPPAAEEIALLRSRAQLEKQVGDNQRAARLHERQMKLLDIKIIEKEAAAEEGKQHIGSAKAEQEQLGLPVPQGIIKGALEQPAVSEGLLCTPDQAENYKGWLENLGKPGGVYLIVGRRGSGKTCLACKMAEYVYAVYGMMVCWVGLPPGARALLPSWINMVDSLEQCPPGCFIIADEAGLQFLSLAFSSDENVILRKLLMICRHKRCSLVFAGQHSKDIDFSVVRESDCTIFKQPGVTQPESERPELRRNAKIAAAAFNQMDRRDRLQAAYVFGGDFEGIITSEKPSFWGDELSHIYANYDLTGLQQRVERNNQLTAVVAEQTKLLNEATLDQQILALRKDHGIDAIARQLGCSQYRVRKCLGGIEGKPQ